MKVARYGALVFVLLQIPFIWAACQTWQLSRYLRLRDNGAGVQVPFQDLRGTIHVHSASGGHSLGTYPEILAAAKQAGYDYLVVTEHAKQPQLFVQQDDSNLIVIYGTEEPAGESASVLTIGDRLRIWSHGPLQEAAAEELNGVELYNMHENGRAANGLMTWVNFAYHRLFGLDLFYFHLWELDHKRFDFWDRQLQKRRLTGVGGNDVHQNIGLILQTASGQKLFSVVADSYLESFRFLSNHVILPRNGERSEETILAALRQGAVYIAFEELGDSRGFSFHGLDGGRPVPMGSVLGAGGRLILQSPHPVRFRLLQSGALFQEFEGTYFEVPAATPGVYRLEVFPLDPPSLIKDKPWIISNPIFVER